MSTLPVDAKGFVAILALESHITCKHGGKMARTATSPVKTPGKHKMPWPWNSDPTLKAHSQIKITNLLPRRWEFQYDVQCTVISFLSCIFALIHVHLYVWFYSSFSSMLYIDLNQSVVIPPIQYTPIKTIRRSGTSVHLQANAIAGSQESVFWCHVPKKRQKLQEQRNGSMENQYAENTKWI